MHALNAFNFSRNDCHYKIKCEHCNHEEVDKYGYNDENYRVNVIPSMYCSKCKLNSRGHHIRWTITAIKSNGLRMLAFDNNHYSNYIDRDDCVKRANDILNNNSEERIRETIGIEPEITSVECYPSGDAIQTIF